MCLQFVHFERGFSLQNEVIPNMTPKEWISTPAHFRELFSIHVYFQLNLQVSRKHFPHYSFTLSLKSRG